MPAQIPFVFQNSGRPIYFNPPQLPVRPNIPVDPSTLPVLTREKIRQLVSHIDPTQRLENDVEEVGDSCPDLPIFI